MVFRSSNVQCFSARAFSARERLPSSTGEGALKINSFVKACVWHTLRKGGGQSQETHVFLIFRSKIAQISPLAHPALANVCYLALRKRGGQSRKTRVFRDFSIDDREDRSSLRSRLRRLRIFHKWTARSKSTHLRERAFSVSDKTGDQSQSNVCGGFRYPSPPSHVCVWGGGWRCCWGGWRRRRVAKVESKEKRS